MITRKSHFPLTLLPILTACLAGCGSDGAEEIVPYQPSPDGGGFDTGDGAGGGGQGGYGGGTNPSCKPACADWQQCSVDKCVTAAGRCAAKTDCSATQDCDLTAHNCVELPDPCTGVTCSGKGACSRDAANQAVCNCEFGYKPNAKECVTDVDLPDWCAVWYPKSFVAHTGDPATKVYGRIYKAGVTTIKSQQAQIKAQLGYTTKAVGYPVVASDLTWVDASFNISGAGDYGSDHEYMADFPSSVSAGQYNYLYRVSVNGGASWTMCDTAGLVKAVPTAGAGTISGDNPDNPVLQLVAVPTIGATDYSFQVKFVPGKSGSEYDPTASQITLNGATATVAYDTATRLFNVQAQGVTPNKYAYLFRAKDKAGKSASLFVPFWVEAKAFQWKDAFLYQIMTDRFVDGDKANNKPVGSPVEPQGDWQGGDLRGVIQKLESGYFDALGVNTVWISSPVANPSTSEPGKNENTGHQFAAYHAYWPIATGWTNENHLTGITTPIDAHFGTADELKELVGKAHAKGMRVLADFVPNHVHDSAPIYLAHKDDNQWWNLPYDDCSQNNGWDNRRTTCWFDPFLPDFKCSSAVVRQTLADHAVWLIQEFNLDGFRVDATKHVEVEAIAELRSRILKEVSTTGLPFYMVGETLGGNESMIKEVIGADRLDGSVNDPFHWAMRDTFLNRTKDAVSLDNFVQHDSSVWIAHYQGALMGNFMGSHDTERAVSIAQGDAYNDRWKNPPPVPTDAKAFKRLKLAQTFLLTYRAVPIIWMGDEYGQPGAADPDNRRMIRFDSDLTTLQTQTLEHARKVGKARAAHSALRSGTRSSIVVEPEFYVYALKDGADVAVVVINLSENSVSRSIDLASLGVTGSLKDAVSGSSAAVSAGKLPVSIEGLGSAVFTN